MRCVLGFDGGGTKTECVLIDQEKNVLGHGRGGPSNPGRVGFEDAALAIKMAAETALLEAGVECGAIVAACAGISGAGDAQTAERMRRALVALFPGTAIEICTDLEIALAAAGEGPAMVLIAGTGSAALGRGITGQVRRAGGLGPQIGDAGSATDVGKKAVIAAKLERDRTGEESALGKQLLRQVGATTWGALNDQAASSIPASIRHVPSAAAAGSGSVRRENYDDVYPRLFPVVANAADAGDELARGLLRDAARDLAALASTLVEQLALREVTFRLAKTGGMIGHRNFFEQELDVRLREAAPNAKIGGLPRSAAHAAALMALRFMPAQE